MDKKIKLILIFVGCLVIAGCNSLNFFNKEKESKMTLEELAKRVQALEDIEAIKQLKATYSEVCDDNYNPSRMLEIFTEDAVWDGGERFGKHTGHKELKEFFTNVGKGLVFGAHFFLQPRITLTSPTTAKANWYLWQTSTMANGKGVWICGLEDDEYRKGKDGKWKMSHMKLTLFYVRSYEDGWHKSKWSGLE